jgi:hypothetical protein
MILQRSRAVTPGERQPGSTQAAKPGPHLGPGSIFCRQLCLEGTSSSAENQPSDTGSSCLGSACRRAPVRSAEFAAKQKRHERKVSADHEDSRSINQAPGIPLDGAPTPGSLTRRTGGGGAYGFDEL